MQDESWREGALRAMLTVAAVVTPAAAMLAIALRAPPRPWLDTLVLASAGLAMPLLRIWPRLSTSTRAAAAIAVLFTTSVYVIARSGLAPGVTVLLSLTSVFGAIYFNRVVGYALLGLGAAAFVAVGWLVTTGALAPPPDMFDPHQFQNWVRVAGTFALLAGLLTSAVAFIIRQVEASGRQLRTAYGHLGQLHLRLEAAKDNERRFLAHELHDELGQSLTALKLSLQLAARGAGPTAGAGPVGDTIGLVDDLIKRVRRMSGDLRPPLLDEVGLIPALRAHLDGQAALSGVTMALETDEPVSSTAPGRLQPDLEMTCFRVVQESVTNALRHAAARNIRVHIGLRPDRVLLSIRDDGQGFDPAATLEAAAAAGHLGVVGMRERIRAQEGLFRFESRPGAGTTVAIELPTAPR